jgi:hypothetical protein
MPDDAAATTLNDGIRSVKALGTMRVLRFLRYILDDRKMTVDQDGQEGSGADEQNRRTLSWEKMS